MPDQVAQQVSVSIITSEDHLTKPRKASKQTISSFSMQVSCNTTRNNIYSQQSSQWMVRVLWHFKHANSSYTMPDIV